METPITTQISRRSVRLMAVVAIAAIITQFAWAAASYPLWTGVITAEALTLAVFYRWWQPPAELLD